MPNVSRHLRDHAESRLGRAAVILADGRSLCFWQLEDRTQRFAAAFHRAGIRPGMRVATFVRPGFDFVPTLYGLFRLGAVPVCIDPGMKLGNLLACVRESAPEAMVGVPLAHAVRRLFPGAFRSCRTFVTVGNALLKEAPREAIHPVDGETPAAILFTSGSTGIPKGVVYTHGAFDGQRALLRETYGVGDDEVDLVVFPLFALFTAAWGIPAVIPRMNPARPSRARGEHLAGLIRRYGVTHTSGSPAIWRNLAAHGERLPSLRRILMAGAQIPESLVRACGALLGPEGEIHTPYGATEALPLTTIGGRELLADCYARTRRGAGTCVGRPVPGVRLAVIPLTDGPIERWREDLALGPGERGEVVARGPLVTRHYFGKPEADRRAKIPDGDGFWHRMGDVGYFDDGGRLWFCGRKDHRIGPVYPDPLEAIFDGKANGRRTAVVGVGEPRRPLLVVEGRRDASLARRLLEAGRELGIRQVVFHRRFPVDVRHNIKIDRLALGRRFSEVSP